MKTTLFCYLLSLVLFNSSVFANVVAKEVHPDKKKFSKTPVSDSINQSDFYVGSQFDYDRDGIPDKVEINGISKYRFIEGTFTWLQAKSDAISKGGYLASITSDTENKKGLKMGDMVPSMVKAIQELSAQVNELKAEVAALKGA